MTTQENKAVVRRFVTSVFEQLNADAIDELVAPDFVSHTWGFKGDPRESLKQVTQRMGDSLSDIAFVIADLIAEDDKVAARLTSSAAQTGEFHGMPPSGKRYSIGEIHIFRHGRQDRRALAPVRPHWSHDSARLRHHGPAVASGRRLLSRQA
jgi:predicted ester cyclase